MDYNEEKREHVRIKSYNPVRYRKLSSGARGGSSNSVSTDISRGGVRFRTREFIPMACRLIIEIDVPDQKVPLKAISKVAWIRKTDSGEEFEIGNKFLSLSEKENKIFEA
ncbi:MAG: PilZ domain-containing protein [Candidatus Omnitrophota bacterium]